MTREASVANKVFWLLVNQGADSRDYQREMNVIS